MFKSNRKAITTSMITDKTYLEMSIESYESAKNGEIIRLNVNQDIDGNWKQEAWEIVKVLNEKETDTQAYAFKNDDKIVIAYRGSQELQDWIETDGSYLVMSSSKQPSETLKEIDYYSNHSDIKGTIGIPSKSLGNYEIDKEKELKNAFDIAVEFTESVKKEHPEVAIHTTGHSLGGALATYVRAMASWVAQTTTFAAPNVYGMLPDYTQESIDSGLFKENTIDYTDKSDTFGVLNDHLPQVGSQHYVDNGSFWLGNHSSAKFHALINQSGQIRLTPEIARQLSERAKSLHLTLDTMQSQILQFQSHHDEVITRVQSDFEARISSEFPLLSVSEVQEIIEKYALSNRHGSPLFYDVGSEDSLLEKFHIAKADTLEISDNLRLVADNFEERDKTVASWLRI